MNKRKLKLTTITFATLLLVGCSPAYHYSSPRPISNCTIVHATPTQLADADYNGEPNPGEWTEDGRVFGYSVEEDSTIYTTRECAR